MRFLADMGVSATVLDHLRSQGHDAVHLRDEGLQRLPDADVLRKASDEQRILLTFDLDFAEIVALSADDSLKVVVLRLRNATPRHVIERLEAVLEDADEALGEPAIVVIEESRHRIRKLPVGA